MSLNKSTCAGWVLWVAVILSIAGCRSLHTPSGGHRYSLHQTYRAGQSSTFRRTSERTRSVEWTGIAPEDQDKFKSGTTGRIIDMTFTQTVQQVDANGAAVAEVTIDRLAYRGYMAGVLALDYDSRRPDNAPTALAAIVGASYGITLSAKGQVLAVQGLPAAVDRIDRNAPHYETAVRLLSKARIVERHSVPALADAPGGPLEPGQTWTRPQMFTFGQMGNKAFKKTYTYKGAEQHQGRCLLRVDMHAASENPQGDAGSEPGTDNPFTAMFQSTDTFSGETLLDCDTGRLQVYHETLEAKWVFVDPASAGRDDVEPRSGQMTARQAELLEYVAPQRVP